VSASAAAAMEDRFMSFRPGGAGTDRLAELSSY